jgi:putative tryptophan/tyrosine transport system substrate-binding protein
MKRRDFITLLGGAAAWPLVARAQQLGAKLPTIGFLGSTTASIASKWVAAFVQRLGELGWIEGDTVAIEYRWAEGRKERADDLSAELVRLKVDVIVTYGTQTIQAAKQATNTIPIVFALPGDPVATGLVASLARPGGNLTGLSSQGTDLATKRLEILRETILDVRRLAIMGNVGNPASVMDMAKVHAAARNQGLDAALFEIRRAEELEPTFEALKGRMDALYIPPDALINTHRLRINALALNARLPTMHGARDYVEGGGFMSYGPSFSDQFRRAAEYVDRILRGAKPAELAVQQPTKFELIINVKTAKALGRTIPPLVLILADELME